MTAVIAAAIHTYLAAADRTIADTIIYVLRRLVANLLAGTFAVVGAVHVERRIRRSRNAVNVAPIAAGPWEVAVIIILTLAVPDTLPLLIVRVIPIVIVLVATRIAIAVRRAGHDLGKRYLSARSADICNGKQTVGDICWRNIH